MKTIIHVHQRIIRDNRKNGTNDPPLTIKTYQSQENAHSVDILDKDGEVVARVIHSPHKPLSCGARLWIETYNQVNTHIEEYEPIQQGSTDQA